MSGNSSRPGALQGLTALVTGGSRGVGAGIVTELAKAGAAVAVVARDAEAGGAVVDEVARSGASAVFFGADLTDEEQVRETVECVVRRFGGLDIVVSNAALTPSRVRGEGAPVGAGGSAVSVPMELWRRYFMVNVDGALLVCRYSLPHLLHAGSGSIVFINSIGTRYAMAGDAGYVTSKSALSGLMRSVAVDFAPRVRANEILCGFVPGDDNPVHQAVLSTEAGRGALAASTLTGTWATPEDVGLACVYLAGSQSRFLTGQSIVLDGGSHVPMRIPYDPDASA